MGKDLEGSEELKRIVEHEFGFFISNWDVIKFAPNSSLVVRIVTNEGKEYAFKSLFITPERQLFIVKSEQMLAERGVGLARPIPTLKGKLYMIYNQVPYVLYEWVQGESAQLRVQRDLESMTRVMAQFHLASRKLVYPPQVKIYEHPHWKETYKIDIRSMKNWLHTRKTSVDRKDQIICREIPFFIRIASAALRALKKSRYQEYINGAQSDKSLVHGDFHNVNLIQGRKKLQLIDFEDVRYDLPSKDLLRLYSMYTRKRPFIGKKFSNMLRIYEKNNPLTPETKQLVYTDLLFPHIFERMLRKKKYSQLSISQLKFRIRQEKKKAKYIRNHMKSWEELH